MKEKADNKPVEKPLEAKGAKIGEIKKIGPKTTTESQRTAARERAKAKAMSAINKLFAASGGTDSLKKFIAESSPSGKAKEAFATLTGGASKQDIVGTVGMSVEPNWSEQKKTEVHEDTALARKGAETGKVAEIGPLALGGKKEPSATEKAAKEAFARLTGGASKQEIVGAVGMNVEPNWNEQAKTETAADTRQTAAGKEGQDTGKVADIGPIQFGGPKAGGGASEKPEA